jgi:ribosome maturation factor RimP
VGCGPRFCFLVLRREKEEVTAMAGNTNDLVEALSPLLVARGLDLVDIERKGGELTVFVDREGGVDLDELSEATKVVSNALDELDPIPGRYLLSVSSPGLERRLRTPAHYQRAVGETVSVRVHGGTDNVRRVQGVLESADESGCTVAGEHIAYNDIERARTVFEWGASPKSKKSEKVARS